MSFSLIAPFFLAGLGLISIPWLIHRIRRPERKPIPFSSLMFIPRLDRQLIERKKMQHLILMLLRMSVLALAAFAFSRPFFPASVTSSPLAASRNAHVIMIDQSYSMGVGERVRDAQAQARDILDSIPETEDVAILAFAERPRMLISFPAEGPRRSRSEMLRAIDSVAVLEEATSYPLALHLAEDAIQAARSNDDDLGGRIYLISDLQESGLGGTERTGWRLSPDIELVAVGVNASQPANRTLTQVAVRRLPQGEFKISGQVKNWSSEGGDGIPVGLVVDGELRDEKDVVVRPHHATQVSFIFRPDPGQSFAGWLELPDDDLAVDNQRYFAWNPPPRKRVLIQNRRAGAERFPSAWFVQNALEADEDRSFDVVTQSGPERPNEPDGSLDRSDVMVLGEVSAPDAEWARDVLTYLEVGGQVLMTLRPSDTTEELNKHLLHPIGLNAMPVESSEPGYRLIEWVDFEHPVFEAFEPPQFNDFSLLRVSTAQHLELLEGGTSLSTPRILARLEGSGGQREGPPALIEAAYGGGRMLVWSFPFDPGETNFMKSARFAPIIHEALRYLASLEDQPFDFRVGSTPASEMPLAGAEVRNRHGVVQYFDSLPADSGASVERSGLLFYPSEEGDAPSRIHAVNVDPTEADSLLLSESEFIQRLAFRGKGSDAESAESGVVNFPERVTSTEIVRKEFGWILILLVLAVLLVELWYAPRLVR